MSKTKIDKEDMKYLIITLIIGYVANYFTESGMNIAMLCSFMYIIHKYIATTKNIKEYDSYKFKNKDKFDKGRRVFVLLFDMYIIIRIISLFIKPQISSIFGEMLLVFVLYIPFDNYLHKKYIENADALYGKRKLVFIKNKIIVSIILFIFVGFSYFTFSSLNELSSNNYVKYGGYEYNLSEINDKRKIEIEIGSQYMMDEENERNEAYFDNYLRKSKDLIRDKIFKRYIFISMAFAFLVCFIETYPKDNNKVNSIISNVFLVLCLVMSIFAFNFETYDKEVKLSSYFHNYISK